MQLTETENCELQAFVYSDAHVVLVDEGLRPACGGRWHAQLGNASLVCPHERSAPQRDGQESKPQRHTCKSEC
jgi:aromatic ring-cleaving dioxygenase